MRAKPLVLPALLTSLVLAAHSLTAAPAAAATGPVELGTAQTFGVLAASTVTNTGPSIVDGDLGLSPGTAVTGFPPGQVTGVVHVADAVALQAQSDTTTAYNSAAGRPSEETISADLAGRTLLPGVYSGTTLALNGTLTLDGDDDPNAVFVLQSGSSLITGTGSSVVLVGGASACNVFWQVGSSATLGVGTSFQGTIAALSSISALTGTQISGRLLARTGAVTLDTTTVRVPLCSRAVAPIAPDLVPTAPAAPATSAPAPTAPAAVPPVTVAPENSTPASSAPASAAPSAGAAPVSPAAPTPSGTPVAPAPDGTARPGPGGTPTGTGPVPALPAPPLSPAAPAAPVSPVAPELAPRSAPFDGGVPLPDLIGGGIDTPDATSTSTSTRGSGVPFLPATGSPAGQTVALGLLALLVGAVLSLAGSRGRRSA